MDSFSEKFIRPQRREPTAGISEPCLGIIRNDACPPCGCASSRLDFIPAVGIRGTNFLTASTGCQQTLVYDRVVETGGLENRFHPSSRSHNPKEIPLPASDLRRFQLHSGSFNFTGFDSANVAFL
jgi:hypothetical protein